MLPYLIAGAIGFGIAKLFEEDKAPKYADGGLIAPNGKPSNLTPEQYELVREPAFKQWFGDWENDPANSSKVVDSNGEPLVVYHGSKSNFNVFDVEKSRFDYLYFAVKKEYAEKFGKTKSYFINARKIKDATSIGLKKITIDKAYKLLGFKSEPTYTYTKDEFWQHLRFSDKINRTLRWNKYDGVKYIESNLDDGSYIETEAFVILNPSIIKLADGTNTTFDSNNPDIRFDKGGNVNSGAFKKWFGNSKVVDKKGNPLIVYHGSPDLRGLKEKYIFESRFLDNQSFFFTDNYSMAKSYADPKRAFDYQNAEEGVIGLYLSLQNPLIVNAFNQIWRKFETNIDGNEIIGTRNLINFAKNKGYDGVIVENVRDYYNNNDKKTKGGNVYVAFYPNQIKLANGSNTTFDGNNPDIRFDGGGLVPKTTKDEYGNWSGSYLGNKFTLYKLREGWEYSIFYYSPIFESNQIYSSIEDYPPFSTKKDALNTLMEQIIEINLENDNFINQKQSKNPDIS